MFCDTCVPIVPYRGYEALWCTHSGLQDSEDIQLAIKMNFALFVQF